MGKKKFIIRVIIVIIFILIIGSFGWMEKIRIKNIEDRLEQKKELCSENNFEFDRIENVCFKKINGFVEVYDVIKLNGSYYIKENG